MAVSLTFFNSLPDDEARCLLKQCCEAKRWIALMSDSRPFSSRQAIREAATKHWQTMEKRDVLEAFAGHPKIGDLDSLRKKFASTAHLAGNEQAGTQQASESCLHDLKQWNQAYEEKFGYIFIICASGLSAQTMLDALKQRFTNEPERELAIAKGEQEKILLLRLTSMVADKETSL